MASSLHQIMITGHLGGDPDMRYTPNGNAVTTIRIGVNRSFKEKTSDEWQTETTWYGVETWKEMAENVAKRFHKGDLVFVQGTPRQRSWEDKNTGEKRFTVDIINPRIEMLLPKSKAQGDYRAAPESEQPVTSAAPSNGNGHSATSDDELPF